MGRAVRALMALVVAGMLALAGCTVENPSNAATANGVEIAERQVDPVAQSLATIFSTPEAPGAQRGLAVTILVGNEVGRAVGAITGVTTSAEDRQGIIAQYTDLTALSQQPGMATIADDYANALLIRTQLGEEAFTAAAADVPVLVNPRYGRWDESKAQVVAESGSLSSPAPSLAPQP